MAESCKIDGCLSVYRAGINMILLRPELNCRNKSSNDYLEARWLPFGFLDLGSA